MIRLARAMIAKIQKSSVTVTRVKSVCPAVSTSSGNWYQKMCPFESERRTHCGGTHPDETIFLRFCQAPSVGTIRAPGTWPCVQGFIISDSLSLYTFRNTYDATAFRFRIELAGTCALASRNKNMAIPSSRAAFR